MTTRKAISKRTRFEVFKRDLFTCQYCGATPPKVILHVDHIIAVANGGTNDADNLATACDSCNLGKSAVPLTSVPKSLKEKAAEVAEREEQLRGYNAVLQAKADRLEDECWIIAAILEHDQEQKAYDRRRLASIRQFLERLPYVEVARITAARWSHSGGRAFRYFCAVCWNKIRKQEGE